MLSPSCATSTVCGVKQKIDSLEEELGNIVIGLFTFLGKMAKMRPDFIEEIRAVLLAIPLKQSMKEQHASFFEEQSDAIENATTVAKLQRVICSYCDFQNVSLFEHLIKELGNEDLKAKLKVYMDHLCDFRASTKIIDYIDAQAMRKVKFAVPSGFVEAQMTLGISWADGTLEDVEEFHCHLCKEASLSFYSVCLLCGKKGSIILVWGLARSAVASFLSAVESGRVKYDLEAVTCEGDAVATGLAIPEAEPTKITEHSTTDTATSDPASPTESVNVTSPNPVGSANPADPVKLEPSAGESSDFML